MQRDQNIESKFVIIANSFVKEIISVTINGLCLCLKTDRLLPMPLFT